MVSYLTTALDFDVTQVDELSWMDASKKFVEFIAVNALVRILPFMRYPAKNAQSPPYNYPGRLFYQHAHALASTYGWSLEYIADLDVDEAMALIQEVAIETIQRQEWEWELSERSVGYDSKTKEYKHNPYPLPAWMMPAPPPPKVYKIPKLLVPVGNVVSYRPDAQSS